MTYKIKYEKYKGKTKAILSDAGGVLFDDTPVKMKYFDFIRKETGIEFDNFYSQFRQYKDRTQKDKNYDLKHAYMDYFRDTNNRNLCDKFQNYLEKMGSQEPKLRLYPGVKETLRELKNKGVKYVIVTDSSKSTDYLKEKLREMGLEGLVDELYSSKTIGATKPSKEFFDEVLKKLNLKKEEVIFVGHDFNEIKGASEYGMRTLYFDPRKVEKSPDEPKNYETIANKYQNTFWRIPINKPNSKISEAAEKAVMDSIVRGNFSSETRKESKTKKV